MIITRGRIEHVTDLLYTCKLGKRCKLPIGYSYRRYRRCISVIAFKIIERDKLNYIYIFVNIFIYFNRSRKFNKFKTLFVKLIKETFWLIIIFNI